MIVFLWSLIAMIATGSAIIIGLSLVSPQKDQNGTIGAYGLLGFLLCIILSVGIITGTHLDGRDFRGNKLTPEATK